MKKILLIILSIFITFSLSANEKLKIGATAVPMAEVLEFIKDDLKKQGIDLQIIVFQDYIMPNKALDTRDLDVNFYQHSVFLDAQIKQHNYKFVNVGAVLLPPIALYSRSYKSLNEVKDGDLVVFSNSVPDRGRVLGILQQAGLIKLKEGITISEAEVSDIVENPKKLKFKYDVDPAFLPTVYFNDEAPLIIINANYALQAGLNPSKDSLEAEDKDSPYVNVVVAREDNKDDLRIQKLVKILQSKKVSDFINTKYEGAVVPVN